MILFLEKLFYVAVGVALSTGIPLLVLWFAVLMAENTDFIED